MNPSTRIKEKMRVNCVQNQPVGEVEHVDGDWLTIRYQKRSRAGEMTAGHQQLPLEWVYSVSNNTVKLNEPRKVVEKDRQNAEPEDLQDWEDEGGSPPDSVSSIDADGVPEKPDRSD